VIDSCLWISTGKSLTKLVKQSFSIGFCLFDEFLHIRRYARLFFGWKPGKDSQKPKRGISLPLMFANKIADQGGEMIVVNSNQDIAHNFLFYPLMALQVPVCCAVDASAPIFVANSIVFQPTSHSPSLNLMNKRKVNYAI
jgi:hypothetical protein